MACVGGEVHGDFSAGVFEVRGDGAGGSDVAVGGFGAGWGEEGWVVRDWAGDDCGSLYARSAG